MALIIQVPVEHGVNSGAEVVGHAAHVVEDVLDGQDDGRRVLHVRVEQTLSVERRPAKEERNHHSHLERVRREQNQRFKTLILCR